MRGEGKVWTVELLQGGREEGGGWGEDQTSAGSSTNSHSHHTQPSQSSERGGSAQLSIGLCQEQGVRSQEFISTSFSSSLFTEANCYWLLPPNCSGWKCKLLLARSLERMGRTDCLDTPPPTARETWGMSNVHNVHRAKLNCISLSLISLLIPGINRTQQ